MSSTAPPVAPAQGVAVTPVVLATGVTSTVPLPTGPNGGPVPWVTPWVVLLNSSPFTLRVTSGSLTTQIAAYTSDKVFCYATGNPITVTPQAGATLPLGGQDTTIYATWYASEPPGTYPAALGSGAALLAQQTTIVPLTTTNLAPANQIGFPGGAGGVFSTLGFGGLTVAINETLGLGPATLTITWADAVLTTVQTRTIIVPAGGSAQFSIPHFAANVAFLIRNNNAAVNINTNFEVIFTALALSAWNVGLSGSLGQGVILGSTALAIPANPAATNLASTRVYAGPAQLAISPNAGPPVFTAQLQTQDGTGAWSSFGPTFKQGSFPMPGGLVVPLIIPPVPLRLNVANGGSGSTYVWVVSLIADDWRVG